VRRSYTCLNKDVQFKSATTQRRRVIERAREAEARIKESLRSARKVALAVDEWSARSLKFAFLAIKAYWIDDDFKHHEELLSFPAITGDHSGENMARYMQMTIDDFEIGDKIIAITTDNASSNATLCRAVLVVTILTLANYES